jgi:hypothetical protein
MLGIYTPVCDELNVLPNSSLLALPVWPPGGMTQKIFKVLLLGTTEWVKPRVWYFHSKNTRVPFSVYHNATEAYFSSNHRKFNWEIQDPKFGLHVAMTLNQWVQWFNNVTMTLRRQERWCHFGPSLDAPTIRMTSLRFNDVNHNAAMWYGKISHSWIVRLTMAKVW